jgi:hypothetical protein
LRPAGRPRAPAAPRVIARLTGAGIVRAEYKPFDSPPPPCSSSRLPCSLLHPRVCSRSPMRVHTAPSSRVLSLTLARTHCSILACALAHPCAYTLLHPRVCSAHPCARAPVPTLTARRPGGQGGAGGGARAAAGGCGTCALMRSSRRRARQATRRRRSSSRARVAGSGGWRIRVTADPGWNQSGPITDAQERHSGRRAPLQRGRWLRSRRSHARIYSASQRLQTDLVPTAAGRLQPSPAGCFVRASMDGVSIMDATMRETCFSMQCHMKSSRYSRLDLVFTLYRLHFIGHGESSFPHSRENAFMGPKLRRLTSF